MRRLLSIKVLKASKLWPGAVVAERIPSQVSDGAGPYLPGDVGTVRLHCPQAHVQGCGDLFAGFAFCHELYHLAFAYGECSLGEGLLPLTSLWTERARALNVPAGRKGKG